MPETARISAVEEAAHILPDAPFSQVDTGEAVLGGVLGELPASQLPPSAPERAFETEAEFRQGRREQIRERWIVAQKSPQTGSTYRAAINVWFAYCDSCGVDVFAAERENADRWRHWLRARYSRASTAKHMSIASSFYAYAIDEAGHDRNPVARAKRPKATRVSPRRAMSENEARELRSAAVGKDPRTAAVVCLLLGTGARVSELCAARTSDLTTYGGRHSLHLTRKGDVPGRVRIAPADWEVLQRYLTTRPDVPGRWLLATTGARRMSRQTAWRIVSELAVEAFGEDAPSVYPHRCRHTFATLALDRVPIQEVQHALGHQSSATTQGYDSGAQGRGDAASDAIADVYAQASA
jgi:site-specific recombinase XerD